MNRRLVRVSLLLVVLLFISTSVFAEHHFHANAFAVGGEDRAAVASVALPSTGGLNESVVRDYNDGFVRFAEARSTVRGTKEGEVAVTATEIVITGLSLGDRVQVDRLIARTNSRQAVDEPEARIDFEGSVVEGLRIDGTTIDVPLDTRWFADHPTFAAVRATGVEPRSGMPGITCSAYRAASCGDGRHGIAIPDLGYLVIGDVHVKNGARSLEMLRLDRYTRRVGRIRALDTPPPPVVVAGVEGNGTPIWP